MKTISIKYKPNTVFLVGPKASQKLIIMNAKNTGFNLQSEFKEGIKLHCNKCKETILSLLN